MEGRKPICRWCSQIGHIQRVCPELKAIREETGDGRTENEMMEGTESRVKFIEAVAEEDQEKEK